MMKPKIAASNVTLHCMLTSRRAPFSDLSSLTAVAAVPENWVCDWTEFYACSRRRARRNKNFLMICYVNYYSSQASHREQTYAHSVHGNSDTGAWSNVSGCDLQKWCRTSWFFLRITSVDLRMWYSSSSSCSMYLR